MKKNFTRLVMPLAGLACITNGEAQTVFWTGAGSSTSWSVAANWSGGAVPGPANDVLITNGLGSSVIVLGSVTVKSLQCSKSLTLQGGSLALTSGASLISGPLVVTSGASLTVNGAGVTLAVSGAAVANDANFYALNGGVLHFRTLSSATNLNSNVSWNADGPGSLLDLSQVSMLMGGFYKRLYVGAYNGGTVDLHRLTSAPFAVTVEAQDSGSIVDLSGLAGRWSSQSSGGLELSVRDGAVLLMPNVTQLEHASLTIEGTNGGVPTAQMNLLTNVTLTVDGAIPNFGMLTNIDDTSVYAQSGGIARLTNVTRMVVGNVNPTWRADGASLVELSRLNTLTEGFYKRLYVEADNGGAVDLHLLSSASSAVTVNAQDQGSVVDLSGVSGRWSSQSSGGLELSVQSGAFLLIPNVTQLEHASLTIQGTNGGVPTAQINLLTNVTLTVDGATPNFGMLTNIDDTSVYAQNGGIARLTNVTRMAVGNVNPTWRADGAASLIDLSRLSALTEGFYKRLYVEAYNGGTVDLHRVASAPCAVTVNAQDPGSVVDLSGLAGRWSSQSSGGLELSVQSGAVLLIPNVTQLEHASLTIQGTTGGVPTAQMNMLTNVTLTVDGATPNFGMLTNIDDTSVCAQNGGLARMTNVTQMVVGNLNPTWRAAGAASLVDLSRLNILTEGFYKRLNVEAYNGGIVDLHGLTSAPSAVTVEARDAKSIVDLSGLSSIMGFGSGASSLTARNGGTILANDQGLLVANTEVDVAPGHPTLPDTLVATNVLRLCAKPWHAYWVEQRDTTQSDSSWTFVMRVALTNNAQLVNLSPIANTELRVWDFVADSPILDVCVSRDSQVQVCLYGPINQNYEVQTTADLVPGFKWESSGTAMMTNAFHIFFQGPAVDPARFYRWKQL